MASMQTEQARRFRDLHARGKCLILPNAWDAGSARLLEDAGAAAIATSSAAVAWAHGYPDGQALPVDIFLRTVREILRVVRVPVSVDSEAGFSDDPKQAAAFVTELAKAGAVGINLEDAASPPELAVAKIAAVKDAVSRADADIFVNARIDVYLRKLAAPEAALGETLARAARYAEAGADGIFVPSVLEIEALRKIVASTDLPVNVLIFRGLPEIAELKSVGVRRISTGAGIGRAAMGAALRAAKDILEKGSYETMRAESAGLPADVNALFR